MIEIKADCWFHGVQTFRWEEQSLAWRCTILVARQGGLPCVSHVTQEHARHECGHVCDSCYACTSPCVGARPHNPFTPA